MARTKTEIINDMGTPPGELTESPLSEWVRWRNIFAAAIEFFEELMAVHESEVEDILSSNQPGSLTWYYIKALEFQVNDSLYISPEGVMSYPVTDSEKQIIARASVSEEIIDFGNNITGLMIKLAKINTENNELEPLSGVELSQFNFYIESIKIAGVQHQVLSALPDLIKTHITVYFKKNIDINQVTEAVISVLIVYRNTLNFNGIVSVSDIYRIIDSLPEITNVTVDAFEWRKESDPVFVPVKIKQLYAGYFNYDVSGTNFQIDFIPEGDTEIYQSKNDLQ